MSRAPARKANAPVSASIPELWSPEDKASVEVLRRAVEDDDLLSALLALEGASPVLGLEVATTIARLSTRVLSNLPEVDEVDDLDAERLELLHAVVCGEFGLRGAEDDYFAAANSKLSLVLERRRGQPILVSAVWMLVGRTAGIDVQGVGFPGHFLIQVEGRLVDAFNDGQALDDADVRRLAERVMPGRRMESNWLQVVGTREIAERVLRNLIHASLRAHDLFGRYRALRMLAGLRPNDPSLQLEVAVLTEELGVWGEAREMYRSLAKTFPESREGQAAEVRRMQMSQRARVLH